MMMTTTTTEQVPHGQLFSIEFGQSKYAGLNRDATWHALALQLDGYAEMQRVLSGLLSWQGTGSWGSREEAWEEALETAVQSGDVDAAFGPVRKSLEARQFVDAANNLHQAALTRIRSQAEQWVQAPDTQTALVALLNAELAVVLEDARKLNEVVDGARSYDDIGPDADRAKAYFEFGQVAQRLRALLTAAGLVVAPDTGNLTSDIDGDPNRWPLAWVIYNYRDAWPSFWRRHELTVPTRGDGRDLVLPPATPPWIAMEPLAFLQWALERGVQLHAATTVDAAKRSSSIDKAARERRRDEIQNRSSNDWTTQGERTEFTV